MVEKYIDLEERIKRDRDLSLTGLDRVTYTLRWLDRNPDQAPGRTITESECHDLYHAAYYGAKAFRGELEDQGFAFIADPEPTNAESIDNLLTEFANLNASCGGEQGDHDLAEFLDARGVRVSCDD